jgi:hypothetical protein
MRTDHFDHIAIAVQDRMPHGMYASCRAVRKSYSKINFDMRFFSDSLGLRFDNPAQIFGENTLGKDW